MGSVERESTDLEEGYKCSSLRIDVGANDLSRPNWHVLMKFTDDPKLEVIANTEEEQTILQ